MATNQFLYCSLSFGKTYCYLDAEKAIVDLLAPGIMRLFPDCIIRNLENEGFTFVAQDLVRIGRYLRSQLGSSGFEPFAVTYATTGGSSFEPTYHFRRKEEAQ